MRSQPYVFVNKGYILPLKGIRYVAIQPITFWGVNLKNELVEIGTTDTECYLDVTYTSPIVCLWWTADSLISPTLVNLIFNNPVPLSGV